MGKKFLLYIHPKQFEDEKEKSKLVNDLLNAHYLGDKYVPANQPSAGVFHKVPAEKPLDKTDYHPTPGVWTLPPAQNEYELCKHNSVLGMCKKGCK